MRLKYYLVLVQILVAQHIGHDLEPRFHAHLLVISDLLSKALDAKLLRKLLLDA